MVEGLRVAFSIEIVPSALAELKAVRAFSRRAIAQAIEEQLRHQPLVAARNRKVLTGVQPPFRVRAAGLGIARGPLSGHLRRR
jgi:hypothetical protein